MKSILFANDKYTSKYRIFCTTFKSAKSGEQNQSGKFVCNGQWEHFSKNVIIS